MICFLILTHDELIELEEERRLFYVGITRAKIATTPLLRRRERQREKRPSPYLEKLNMTKKVTLEKCQMKISQSS